MVGKSTNSVRLHEWDEENRLHFVLGEKFAGYYGYDGNGERVYKLTGTSSIDRLNSGEAYATATFDNAVLYPNPYIVVTKKGYTKHYYAGSERIATAIGQGGLHNPIDELTKSERDVMNRIYLYYYNNEDPFLHDGLLKGPERTQDIYGESIDELEYQSEPLHLDGVDILFPDNILGEAIYYNEKQNGKEDMVFFSHSDHLGSANWVTDLYGIPVQYIHYAPYGEMMANKNITDCLYRERYKFTGKERDSETGYDYFGARFFWSALGHWLSVDPLADKYPGISPYAYCAWNPLRLTDPDGRGPKDRVILARHLVEQNIPYNQDEGYYLRTATSPEALATMDCSEFVCRVMAGDCITPTIESHCTSDLLVNIMGDETKFIKSAIPQAGDFVLWNGHTGVVESYNESSGYVTVLHATRYGEIKDETGKVVSYKVCSTRREKYHLDKYYRGKHNAFFYRPVNETPDVLDDASLNKLMEITVKPSKGDQNEDY